MNEWMQTEIETGFQQLICLGLDRQPAMDLMGGTVLAWMSALNHNRVWDQTPDAPRFRKTFLIMMSERKTWPTPKDFIEAMPPRDQLALTKQPITSAPDDPKVKAMMDRIGAMLRMPS